MKKCLIHICNNVYKTFTKVTGAKEPKIAIPSGIPSNYWIMAKLLIKVRYPKSN
jgi:hypothetical protein